MIVVNLMGGLGNQLFQYAAAKQQALRLNVPLRFFFEDPYKGAQRNYALYPYLGYSNLIDKFQLKSLLPEQGIFRRIKTAVGLPIEKNVFREKENYKYDDRINQIPSGTILIGFWQSYKYFNCIESNIRLELVLKKPSLQYVSTIEYLKSLPNPVSFHIRRGDYSVISKNGCACLPLDYYRSASTYLKERIKEFTPLIFSDDYAWSKENLNFLPNAIYAEKFKLPDFEEIMLMTACTHHVIANSSFSWWAAWLNASKEKIVIAPEKWHSSHTAESQLLPYNWIKL